MIRRILAATALGTALCGAALGSTMATQAGGYWGGTVAEQTQAGGYWGGTVAEENDGYGDGV